MRDVKFPKRSSMQFTLLSLIYFCIGSSPNFMSHIHTKNPALIPAENIIWEPPTEHVFCFTVLAARQGGVPEIKVLFTSTPA